MRTFTIAAVIACVSCAGNRDFPLRDPIWRDTDLASVNVRCHKDDHKHVSCAPIPYKSSLYWDGADNLVFRPLSEALGVVTSGESINVNSMDEVADSSWFTNRLGRGAISESDLRANGCKPEELLDPDSAPDASWVIDKGKSEGSTGGFRVSIPGKGKFMLKAEDATDHPERQSAATVIGTSVFHAVGFNTTCEQLVYIRPSVLKLTPHLIAKGNFKDDSPFDKKALDEILAHATKRNGLIRMTASRWLGGFVLGPYRYTGTRDDDPNDVIPHESRRELRGERLVTAWLGRYDGREENSLDTWVADNAKVPDSSPGKVMHYTLDTSEIIGGDFGMGTSDISRRLNHSYIVDWGDLAADFITLGIVTRPWDTVHITPGHEIFGLYDLDHFDAASWKNEYPNMAFSRMTERDAAWMARILAHFTPAMVGMLAKMGNFTDPSNTAYLTSVLEGRLERVLGRYLLRLSPITDVRIDGSEMCGVDLAEWRGVRDASLFSYSAKTQDGLGLAVTRRGNAVVCVTLAHDQRVPYLRVSIADGVALKPLIAHVRDLGDRFVLVGLER